MRVFMAAAVSAVLVASTAAHAADPLNSSNRPSTAAEPTQTEINIVPAAGGTTDIGIGGGFFAGLTRIKQNIDPYLWDLSSAGFITFKGTSFDNIQIPYQDIFVKLTVPRLFGSPARLEIRGEYSRESTLGYYGLGNASTDAPPPGAPDTYYQYGRTHPALDVAVRWRIVDHVAGMSGFRYTANWIQVAGDSRLAQDLAAGSSQVKDLLGPTDPHSSVVFKAGFLWDSRDNEVAPSKGTFADATVKLSPGGALIFPRRYGQVNVTYRRFVPLVRRRLTLAMRGVADVLFGDPPFYELSAANDTYALGGLEGVRGIPGQRYYGKVKVFGNIELRLRVAAFHALGKPLLFGLTAFFDGGRVWADTKLSPALDGHDVGLKYGTGGGLRLQSGTAFVLRADVAWSPDARPISGYVAAGEVF
jgi:outer membrane protein assembly factor BamA